jgi:hypothetical protein
MVNAANCLYNDLKSHSYDMFSIETGEVKDWDPKVTKNMSSADAEKVLHEYAERDKIPHVTAFLAIVPIAPKRNEYFTRLFKAIEEVKKWKVTNPAPTYMHWSAPALPRCYLPEGTPHDFPEYSLRLSRECGVPATPENLFLWILSSELSELTENL